jgi:peptide/nickel transport system substrate-binding protein
MSRLMGTFFLILLLSSSIFALAVPDSKAQSQSTSCPQNDVLRFTTYPIPNSFNVLTAASYSPFFVNFIEYPNIWPYPLGPNGSPDWGNSMTDWISTNANYTQWTFNVKPGLKWSDGTNMTAQDILNTYSSQYALNPSYDFVGLHSEITNAYALNSSAAVFVLNQSDAHLAEKMSSLIYTDVVPPSAIALGPGDNLFGTQVGGGPFYVTNYTSGSSSLVMKRNPYFNPLPIACEIDVTFSESNTQSSLFLVSGAADLAGPLDPSNIPAILSNPNIHLLDTRGQGISVLTYNVTIYPYNMTAFRQALAFGINESQIVSQSYNGYAVPASNAEGGVSPTYPLYNSNIKQYSFDQNQSIALLQSIGITKGSDGHFQYPNGTDITLTIWTDTDQTFDSVTAGIVQADLQNMGFNVNLQITKQSNILGDYAANTQGIRSAMIIFANRGPFFGDAWLDAQPGWNVYEYTIPPNSHWEYPPSADAEYQANYSAIVATNNLTIEQQDLNNIQALNSQYLPVIPLAYQDEIFAYNAQHWTNWPTDAMEVSNYQNQTALAVLEPLGATSQSTTSSTSSSSTTSTPSGTTSTSSVSSTVSSSQSTTSSLHTTSSSPATLSGTTLTAIAAVVVVIIIIAGVVIYSRRRGK